MTEARIALLEGLTNARGEKVWFWDGEEQWMATFNDLVAYIIKYERIPPPSVPVLGTWCDTQRQAKKGQGNGTMTEARIKLLEALPGWKWTGRFPTPKQMKTLIAEAKAAGTFPPRVASVDALVPETDEAPAKRPSPGVLTPPPAKRTRTISTTTPAAASVSTGQHDTDESDSGGSERASEDDLDESDLESSDDDE